MTAWFYKKLGRLVPTFACPQCGCTLTQADFGRHEIWHQSLFDSIEGLANVVEVNSMRQQQVEDASWRDGFISG